MNTNMNKKSYSAIIEGFLRGRSPASDAFAVSRLCYSPDSYYFCALKIKRQIHT